ncbi:MAG: YrhK family protein [Pseudomonadota bacterium]
MGFFHPANCQRSARHQRLAAVYELCYTAVDFTAGALFVIGSILFFGEATTTLGSWLFLVGSLCFMLSPTIRLVREIHYWRIGRTDKLAVRALD